MAYAIDVDYYNSFLLKTALKDVASPDLSDSEWPGLPWNPTGYPVYPFGSGAFEATNNNWYIEESRIRGGFNNTSVDFGVRAYITDEDAKQDHRESSLIYSGIYNPRTGVNETNVFPPGEAITKSLSPANGSIQKLHAENTNLTIFQENKVSKALIDKDAIYSAEGAGNVTSTNLVIGQIVPYLGEYGISDSPESFAVFGFRKYFADRNRALILRLSRDGITEISQYGMTDYFRDYLASLPKDWVLETTEYTITSQSSTTLTITSSNCCNFYGALVQYKDANGNWIDATLNQSAAGLADNPPAIVWQVTDNGNGTCTIDFGIEIEDTAQLSFIARPVLRLKQYYKSKIIGGWDIHNSNYVLSMQKSPRYISTELSSYNTLSFDESVKGWVSFLTYKPDFITSLKDKYYTLIDKSLYQHYFIDQNNQNRGLFYNVRNNSSITFILNPNPSISKNFNTINYEGSNGWQVDYFKSDFEGFNLLGINYVQKQDETNSVKSYDEGKYTDGSVIYRAGFNRKENKYVANLINASSRRPGEVIFNNSMSGVKGYFAAVKISTDDSTDLGGAKEIFAVSSNFVTSSY